MDPRVVRHVAIEAFDPIRKVRRCGHERAINDRYSIHHLIGEQRTHDSSPSPRAPPVTIAYFITPP